MRKFVLYESWDCPSSSYGWPHAIFWVPSRSAFFFVCLSYIASFDPVSETFDIKPMYGGSTGADLLYVNNKFYAAVATFNGGAILELDWDTGDCNIRFESSLLYSGGRCIATDGEYLYLVSSFTGYDSRFAKVKIADWSSSEITLTDVGRVEGMTFDGTYCWLGSIPDPAKLARVRVSDLDYTITTLTGFKFCTDDIADTGDYLYLSSEGQSAYCKVKKSDQSFNVETGNGDIPPACWGAFYIDGYVYFVYNMYPNPAKVMELNPVNDHYYISTLPPALGTNVNEIAKNGSGLYFTQFESIPKIINGEFKTMGPFPVHFRV